MLRFALIAESESNLNICTRQNAGRKVDLQMNQSKAKIRWMAQHREREHFIMSTNTSLSLPDDYAGHIVASRSIPHGVRGQAVVEELFADLGKRQFFLVIDSHFHKVDHLLRRQRVPVTTNRIWLSWNCFKPCFYVIVYLSWSLTRFRRRR